MKTALVAVALACLAPGLGFAATLTGSNVVSSASVNLSTVGTLDWARWPGYTHKGTAISDVTTTGWLKSYSSDARLIGDSSGIKTGGVGAAFTFTGYYFAGSYKGSGTSCKGPDRCIAGYFTHYVDLNEVLEVGPSPDLGLSIVTLESEKES